MDENLDALFERLTLEKRYEDPRGGLYGGYGGDAWRSDFNRWYWWNHNTDEHPKDIAYRDDEGRYHRVYGPAYIGFKYEIEEWYIHGIRHREGGPAIIHKDTKIWMKDGKLHRLDGPAIEDPGGPKQYWIDGQKLPPKQYKKEIARRTRKGLL